MRAELIATNVGASEPQGHELRLTRLRPTHLAPPDEQVRPRLPLPLEQLGTGRAAEAPALINAYLKCGGKLLGPPAWDPEFGTADLPMMLRLSEMPASHRRRIIGQ
jgi:putative hemolysin